MDTRAARDALGVLRMVLDTAAGKPIPVPHIDPEKVKRAALRAGKALLGHGLDLIEREEIRIESKSRNGDVP